MYVRGYLRASTDEQDATRARADLERFASDHGRDVVSWYIDNASGATTNRAELLRLLSDARPGDVLLVEAVDRLSRLSLDDWKKLRAQIDALGLRVVAIDLPTSHAAMTAHQGDDFTARMLDAVNCMMLDVLAAVARKDYEDRRKRQRQGIARAKQEGKYQGRPKDDALRARIASLLGATNPDGSLFSIRQIAKTLDCSPTTVKAVKAERRAKEANAEALIR
ncbi:recombinase family protein [Halomonas sp. OfavH-34-E]|uniref:recombinase family protein n=1 Tax=Halomonas sp. OfavH-34-E TaxID=2954491 RepID=UPI0020969BC4|nr:recombinase family protein [Halomonas sp. OfavH-34-E]MCO7217112.1 recombinase family protein [Halomonas sp. OfavH-34-E]